MNITDCPTAGELSETVKVASGAASAIPAEASATVTPSASAAVHARRNTCVIPNPFRGPYPIVSRLYTSFACGS